MFELLSWVLKYIFIILIYMFIFKIIRMIYMDINTMNGPKQVHGSFPYLKLINRRDRLEFDIDESYVLYKKTTIMGRDKKNDIVLGDPFVSGEHVRIIADEGLHFLEDLGSANGTYVNGEQISDVVVLKDGDRISLGHVDFLFVKDQK